MKRLLNELAKHLVNAGGNLDHWIIAAFLSLVITLLVTSLIHASENHDARLDVMEAKIKAMQLCK